MNLSTRNDRRVRRALRDNPDHRFRWIDLALAVSGLAVFFQILPGAWWRVLSATAAVFSYVDVRDWTWRSYAVVCIVAIAALIVIKSRQDTA